MTPVLRLAERSLQEQGPACLQSRAQLPIIRGHHVHCSCLSNLCAAYGGLGSACRRNRTGMRFDRLLSIYLPDRTVIGIALGMDSAQLRVGHVHAEGMLPFACCACADGCGSMGSVSWARSSRWRSSLCPLCTWSTSCILKSTITMMTTHGRRSLETVRFACICIILCHAPLSSVLLCWACCFLNGWQFTKNWGKGWDDWWGDLAQNAIFELQGVASSVFWSTFSRLFATFC